MSAIVRSSVTSAGRTLIEKAAIGEEIMFTKIVLGDGELAESQTIGRLSGVISPVMELDISACKIDTEGNAVVTAYLNGDDVDVGFWYREVGLYASDPDEGEILYCYGYAGDEAEYIGPSGGISIIEKTIDIVTIIGEAQNVSAFIKADAIATVADYEELRRLCLRALSNSEYAVETSDEAIELARKTYNLLIGLNDQVLKNKKKIRIMWVRLFNEGIAQHPFTIDFDDLEDINLSTGVWNADMKRLEC